MLDEARTDFVGIESLCDVRSVAVVRRPTTDGGLGGSGGNEAGVPADGAALNVAVFSEKRAEFRSLQTMYVMHGSRLRFGRRLRLGADRDGRGRRFIVDEDGVEFGRLQSMHLVNGARLRFGGRFGRRRILWRRDLGSIVKKLRHQTRRFGDHGPRARCRTSVRKELR